MLVRLCLSWLLLAGAAPSSELAQAQRLIDEGELDAAKAVLQPLIEAPEVEPQALVLITTVRNAFEDPAAVRSGRQAVARLPDDAEAHYRYAEALRIKMTKSSKLGAMFSLRSYKRAVQRAIELDAAHVLARREEIGYLSFAPAIGGGDPRKARERISALMPIDRPVALACRAELRVSEEDFEGARGDYLEVLATRPGDAEARLHLALVLYRLGRDAEADRQLDLLTSDDGISTTAELLRHFIETAPSDARSSRFKSAAHSRLGDELRGLEQTAAASQEYRRALALDSKNSRARQAIDGH